MVHLPTAPAWTISLSQKALNIFKFFPKGRTRIFRWIYLIIACKLLLAVNWEPLKIELFWTWKKFWISCVYAGSDTSIWIFYLFMPNYSLIVAFAKYFRETSFQVGCSFGRVYPFKMQEGFKTHEFWTSFCALEKTKNSFLFSYSGFLQTIWWDFGWAHNHYHRNYYLRKFVLIMLSKVVDIISHYEWKQGFGGYDLFIPDGNALTRTCEYIKVRIRWNCILD